MAQTKPAVIEYWIAVTNQSLNSGGMLKKLRQLQEPSDMSCIDFKRIDFKHTVLSTRIMLYILWIPNASVYETHEPFFIDSEYL